MKLKKKQKRRIDLGEGDDYRLCWKLTATQVRVDWTQTNHVWDVKSVYTDECELRMNTQQDLSLRHTARWNVHWRHEIKLISNSFFWGRSAGCVHKRAKQIKCTDVLSKALLLTRRPLQN